MTTEEREQAVQHVFEQLASYKTLRLHALSDHMFHRDISLAQLHVLFVLGEGGPVTVSQLAQLFQVSLPSTSAIVDRLEERGYVQRNRSMTDRRVVDVEITERGRAVTDEFAGVRREEMLAITGAMSDRELREFVRGVDAVAAAIPRLLDSSTDKATKAS